MLFIHLRGAADQCVTLPVMEGEDKDEKEEEEVVVEDSISGSSMLRQLLVFLVFFMCTVHAGTWLAFNDFGGDGVEYGGYRGGSIKDLVHACRENPKVAKDGTQEHEAMCRILLRMTRSV